jgi:hypothetical protein
MQRLPGQTSMEAVLRRPLSDEVEDYKEYKRLRQVWRSRQIAELQSKGIAVTPKLTVTFDGAGRRIASGFRAPHPSLAEPPKSDEISKHSQPGLGST